MGSIERIEVTLPSELASAVRDAVADGPYGSESAVIEQALREWQARRARSTEELRREIDRGLNDAAEGRFADRFDLDDIIAAGRRLSAPGSHSG